MKNTEEETTFDENDPAQLQEARLIQIIQAQSKIQHTVNLIANSLLRDASDIQEIKKCSKELQLNINALAIRVDRLEYKKSSDPLRQAEVQYAMEAVTKSMKESKHFNDQLTKRLAHADSLIKKVNSALTLRTVFMFIIALAVVVWQLTGKNK